MDRNLFGIRNATIQWFSEFRFENNHLGCLKQMQIPGLHPQKVSFSWWQSPKWLKNCILKNAVIVNFRQRKHNCTYIMHLHNDFSDWVSLESWGSLQGGEESKWTEVGRVEASHWKQRPLLISVVYIRFWQNIYSLRFTI